MLSFGSGSPTHSGFGRSPPVPEERFSVFSNFICLPEGHGQLTDNPTLQAIREMLASGVRLGVQDRLAMMIPGYASATTFVANKVPAVLPSGDIHRRTTFGLFKPAYLVGVTSKWNDPLATPSVHRELLLTPGRNIRIRSRFGPHPAIANIFSIVLWRSSI